VIRLPGRVLTGGRTAATEAAGAAGYGVLAAGLRGEEDEQA
jgi:hypothetical protein